MRCVPISTISFDVVIGTLREEDLLDNTVICFTSDHGDMLGNHGMWAKKLFYEPSANVPLILTGAAGCKRTGRGPASTRASPVGRTSCPLCSTWRESTIPASVEGLSLVGEKRRDLLYGEVGEGDHATRMIRRGRYKTHLLRGGDIGGNCSTLRPTRASCATWPAMRPMPRFSKSLQPT